MALSDLWSVTALMCLASTLRSDQTVTVVALTQWFVRCGLIPAAVLIVFIILVIVDSPTGELQYQTLSFSGLNFADSSLGRWNRQFGIKMLEEIFNCFDVAAAGIYYFKHLSIGFVCRIVKPALVVFGGK